MRGGIWPKFGFEAHCGAGVWRGRTLGCRQSVGGVLKENGSVEGVVSGRVGELRQRIKDNGGEPGLRSGSLAAVKARTRQRRADGRAEEFVQDAIARGRRGSKFRSSEL